MYKRPFDLFCLFLSTPVTLPLIGFTFILLKLTQKGSPFFKQERIGLNGKTFWILKFKTMRDGDEPDMERITKIGNFLRKTSLDELPELLNVLKGEMSLVGPRPLPTSYRDHYSEEEFKRHDILPGLTGLAQVHGRNQNSWEQKFKLDLEYKEKMSAWYDFKIIIETYMILFKTSQVNASSNNTMTLLSDRLHIIGAGGHAKVVYETALAAGYEIAGVYDDNPKIHGQEFFSHQIQSTDNIKESYNVVLAIGSNNVREAMSKKFNRFATIIHPSCIISESSQIDEGAVIFAGSIIQAHSHIKSHSIVNTNSNIDHDCIIESFVHIAPGVSLCGGVKVGARSLLGVNSHAIPLVEIAKDSIIAAGATVTKNITEEKQMWAGTPAQKKNTNLRKVS